jgi:hypothetical protein
MSPIAGAVCRCGQLAPFLSVKAYFIINTSLVVSCLVTLIFLESYLRFSAKAMDGAR